MRRLAAALAAWGPPGVFLLAAIDSGGLPLPTGVDTLLVLTAATSPAQAYFSALLATLGSLIGSFFLFWLGRKGGERYLSEQTTSPRTRRFKAWFQQYGLITVFVPLLLPVPLPAKIFVLSAGALGVAPVKFVVVVAAARIPRYFALAYLGSRLGDQAGPWIKSYAWHIGAFALALIAGLYLLARWVDREPSA